MKLDSIKVLVAAVGGVLACGAAAAATATCPVIYAYVGTVSGGGSGIYSPVPDGAQVTGTYTFDIGNVTANGNGASNTSFGPVGSIKTGWSVSNGGIPGSIPTAYAFSSTMQVAGFSYSTNVPDPASSGVGSGYQNDYDFTNYRNFTAGEGQTDRAGNNTSSSLHVQVQQIAGQVAFDRFGLPRLTPSSSAWGQVETGPEIGGNILFFYITSLTPVFTPARCAPE